MQSSISLLSELIRCKPVTSDVAAVNKATTLLQDYLESQGVSCIVEDLDGRKILYASTLPGKEQDFLLNAHLDVVPATDDMFIPRVEGNRLYGRGAFDDLSNAVCIARLLCKFNGKASVSAIFSTDEEVGGDTTKVMMERGYSCRKMAIVLDGPGKQLAIAQKGILIMKLIAKSKGGHASEPWNFDNPIEKLLNAYKRLRDQWQQPSADNQWQNTMAPCIIEGGSAQNQIPDEASMTLNFRITNEADREKIIAQVKELCGLEIELGRHCEPVVSDENSPLLQKMLKIMRKHFSEDKVNFIRMNGATDARHMVGLGVPIAITSVVGDGCHASVEWVDLNSIEEYLLILEEVISSI